MNYLDLRDFRYGGELVGAKGTIIPQILASPEIPEITEICEMCETKMVIEIFEISVRHCPDDRAHWIQGCIFAMGLQHTTL